MRAPGPAVLAGLTGVGAVIALIGGTAHVGPVWALGVVLVALGLGLLLAGRTVVGAVVLGLVLVGGLGVLPWSMARADRNGQATWPDRVEGPFGVAAKAAGGRVLERDGSVTRLVAGADGKALTELGTSGELAWLAPDGSFVVGDVDRLTAYGPDGRRRWRTHTPGFPAAAADGIVVVSGCRGKRCVTRGLDAQGRTRWSLPRIARFPTLTDRLPPLGDRRPDLLPDLAVVAGPGGRGDTVLDPRDGHPLLRSHSGDVRAMAPGRALLQTERPDKRCRIEIVARGSHTRSDPLPCGRMIAVADRAYVSSLSRGTWTADLRTGRVRAVGRVALPGDSSDASAVPGRSVIVRRRGMTITAEDAGSGRRLWSRELGGDDPPEVATQGDLVTAVVRPHGLNPFVGGETREHGDELLVLDARTGDQRASLTLPGGLRLAVGIGRGRVLAIGNDGAQHVAG